VPQRRTRRLFKLGCRAVCRAYLRLWHRFEAHGLEHLPSHGPGLALINHASLLDIPALIAVDPFENGTMVAKASLFKVPLVRQVLDAWGAIPVERRGRDLAGIRALIAALRQGRIVAVAAEGRRTRSGRLEPIHPVLARIALNANVPLIPVGIAGSFAALPPGGMFPRPRKIVLRVGESFRLPPGTSEEEAACRIRDAIAALLPPKQRPLAEGLGTGGRAAGESAAAPGL
jgi:1-acyl-sn-glycerol-3-phosphate acyltransferase